MAKLDTVIAEINKKFGKGTIQLASEAKSLVYKRIPTGIFNLDLAVGGGYGLPRGRVSLITGDKSSGKTTICKKTIATWQRHCRFCGTEIKHRVDVNYETGEIIKDYGVTCECGKNVPLKCAYLDGEGAYDPVWASALGVNNSEVLIIQPDFAEQAVDIVEALIRTGEVDLIVVDSIASLVPSVEIEASAEDAQIGVHAKLMNKFMRAISAGMNSLGMDTDIKPHVILVNQIRQKVGILFGNPNTIPGGKGQEFTASITIEMRTPQKIGENGKLNPKQDDYEKYIEIVGTEHNFEVVKNKTYPPFKRGTFRVYNQDVNNTIMQVEKGEINNIEQIVNKAVFFNIIESSGSWFTYGGEKMQGLQSVINYFKERPLLTDILKNQVIEAYNKQ